MNSLVFHQAMKKLLSSALALASFALLLFGQSQVSLAECGDYVIMMGDHGKTIAEEERDRIEVAGHSLDSPFRLSSDAAKPFADGPCRGPHCKRSNDQAPVPPTRTVSLDDEQRTILLIVSSQSNQEIGASAYCRINESPVEGEGLSIRRPPRVSA